MAARSNDSPHRHLAVEAGEATPSIGTYLRVMSALGVAGELALLGSGALQSGSEPVRPAGKHAAVPLSVTVKAASQAHDVQDLQSLVLHQEAVRLMRSQPALILPGGCPETGHPAGKSCGGRGRCGGGACAMNREDLAHIIRAAADVTNEYAFIIVGSQSILEPIPYPPDVFKRSAEADKKNMRADQALGQTAA